ncbi:MAG TPA: DUF192 domain-containing protein, partial [Beijerinckiaceae bacterium]|nr:DUF192 domain-containing protein [Beijerinckiaceae bacterium]
PFCVALIFVTATLSAAALAQSSRPTQMERSSLEPLTIVTATGPHLLQVAVMRTRAQLEKGLMFRKRLPADEGMLFDFRVEQTIMMWMKNTYIPLDMIFMSRAGVVTHVARDAKPLSQKIIPSDGPVYAVLEVNAGLARKLAIMPGDRVDEEIFRK